MGWTGSRERSRLVSDIVIQWWYSNTERKFAPFNPTIYKSIIGDESRPSHSTQGETIQVQTKRRGRGPSERGANWTRVARWSTLGVS